ncbi:uncharacterized protein CELE_ZK596.3 [Caenorhabditis elegans]|uniref:Transmembrane protein n=1 Tax=Caenorhabditis elegans TaxID=6239 RepID=Q23547_CAEEL|nr:Transmembrane protein [Caenorhabditis elegans]CAA93432.2 Transmembrane protein [Caenorhabditis elegans]|eukprot:NP_502027.2 Uncharacterized protein CELE_ZK596.3 [Caenorhabditis elegans]
MNKQDDEEFNSYFAMDAHYMGRIFFTMSTCLTLGGLYFAAHPHYLEESWNSNGTHYVIENYKVYPNGTKYYELERPDGTIFVGGLGPWFDRLLMGEWRYWYGNTFYNYCRPRDPPRTEWMTSILRSMNHLVIVQVFFRSAVLLSMTHALFQCMLINFVSMANHSPTLERIIGFPLVTVETVHNLCLYVISALQYEQDSHLMQYTRMAMILLTISTVLKLIFVAIIQTNHLLQVACVILASGVILSHNTALEDFDSFLVDTHCDSMALPSVAFSQLIYFLAFFTTGYLQYQCLAGIRVVTCSTPEELEHRKRFCEGPIDLIST